MKEILIETLEKICPKNVYLQGTFAENESYPENFITFWTDSTENNSFYDNNVCDVNWLFSVMYYSTDPTNVATVPATITKALKNAGFIPQGKGFDVICDRPSHSGWAMDFIFNENVKKEG